MLTIKDLQAVLPEGLTARDAGDGCGWVSIMASENMDKRYIGKQETQRRFK